MEIDKNKLSELVLKLQAGDGKAFEQIYNLTNKSAYFTALKITKNEDDAQDVLQEAYIKLLEKVNELDKPESFMSWFNMIVANKAKDFMRKNNPNLFTDNVISGGKDGEEEFSVFDTIEEDNEEFIPGAGIEQAELQRQVMGLIESLSDEKRTAILLYYYNEMTTKQIAESLGVNENTVKSRLVQAKKDLAKGVKELEKKNGKLLGIAPIPVVIWALKASSTTAGAAYIASGAATATFTAITAATAIAGTSAGTAATVGGVVAGITLAQKVAAVAVTAAVIAGGSVTAKTVIDNRNAKETTAVNAEYISEEAITSDYSALITYTDEPETETQLIQITEESSTFNADNTSLADISVTTSAHTTSVASAVTTQATTSPATSKATTAKPTDAETSTKATTTRRLTTTTKPTTTKPTTTKREVTTRHTTTKVPTTTKATTTATTTQKPTTTTRPATTTKPTTTKKVTTTTNPTTTTTKPTTTESTTKKSAIINITITKSGTEVDSTQVEVMDGDTLTIAKVKAAVAAKGYDTSFYEYSGLALPVTVVGGNTYELEFDVE